jgi:hypothetical protein
VIRNRVRRDPDTDRPVLTITVEGAADIATIGHHLLASDRPEIRAHGRSALNRLKTLTGDTQLVVLDSQTSPGRPA